MPPNANAAGFRNNNARIKNIDVVAAMLINVVEKNPYGVILLIGKTEKAGLHPVCKNHL